MTLKELRASLRRARARARHYGLLARKNKALAKRRVRQIKERTTGAKGAVRWALNQVGTVEQPAFSNKGPKITQWQVDSGYPNAGVPWCQCFVNAAAKAVGCPQVPTGYTVWVLGGRYPGYKPVPVSEAKPGDFIYVKFPGVSNDRCDHVGMLVERVNGGMRLVEGNTSAGTSGSQNNGGGVYVRVRPSSVIVGAVRPPYPEV